MSFGEQSGDGIVDELPLKQGAIAGAAAYVVGYVLTYVLLTVDGEVDLSAAGDSDAVGSTDAVGWIFYNAHFVDLEVSAGPISLSGDLLSEGLGEAGVGLSFQFPTLLYRLVPVIVLLVAGYLLVSRVGLPGGDSQGAAKAGATLAVGYLPLALVGAFLFTITETGGGVEGSLGPSVAMAALLAGIVYPVVLGAAGGYLGSEV